jgi:hypothetical protein
MNVRMAKLRTFRSLGQRLLRLSQHSDSVSHNNRFLEALSLQSSRDQGEMLESLGCAPFEKRLECQEHLY